MVARTRTCVLLSWVLPESQYFACACACCCCGQGSSLDGTSCSQLRLPICFWSRIPIVSLRFFWKGFLWISGASDLLYLGCSGTTLGKFILQTCTLIDTFSGCYIIFNLDCLKFQHCLVIFEASGTRTAGPVCFLRTTMPQHLGMYFGSKQYFINTNTKTCVKVYKWYVTLQEAPCLLAAMAKQPLFNVSLCYYITNHRMFASGQSPLDRHIDENGVKSHQ